MDFATRITKSFTQIQPVISKVSEKCKKLIIYEHEQDEKVKQTHIHMLLIQCEVSTDTLKNWIKKEIDNTLKGNKSWAWEEKDVSEKYIQYMSKGKLEPKYNKGFTQEEIDIHKNNWVDYKRNKQSVLQFKLIEETPQQRKLRQKEMIDEIIKRFNQIQGKKHSIDLVRIIREVVVHENRNIISRFKIRDYFDTCVMLIQGEASDHRNDMFVSEKYYVSFN